MAEISKQISKAKLLRLWEQGRIKIIKRRTKKMQIKKLLYNSRGKRVAMRFLEIFIVAGLIALLDSPELVSLLGPVYIGILAAAVKALREGLSKIEWENNHTEVPNLEDVKAETSK